MTDKMLINVTPQETRIALLEGGALREIFIERAHDKSLISNIYLGIVVRVLPGLQAAFVDVGLKRTGFLHTSDLASDPTSGDEAPPISSLRPGQTIMLQVIKDPVGDKGACLTGRISLPSRDLVYLPTSDYLGISRQITDPASRKSLLAVLTAARALVGVSDAGAIGGFILRTATENADHDEICAAMQALVSRWEDIVQRRDAADSAPALIHQNAPLILRTVRDRAWRNGMEVWIDSADAYQQVADFVAESLPDTTDRIHRYRGGRALFAEYGVEDELRRALQQRVELPAGGYLVFDQTEALTAVDINTGSFVGQDDLEETVFQTNLEAATVLAQQLRLRNIGGLIIVDFIDMHDLDHCEQVMSALEQTLAQDHTQTQIAEMSSLGLVEITRKRTHKSLLQLVTEPCPACRGCGFQKTAQSVCYEILREILHQGRASDALECAVVAAPAVIARLQEKETANLSDLQKFIDKPIDLRTEPTYQPEQFHVVFE